MRWDDDVDDGNQGPTTNCSYASSWVPVPIYLLCELLRSGPLAQMDILHFELIKAKKTVLNSRIKNNIIDCCYFKLLGFIHYQMLDNLKVIIYT